MHTHTRTQITHFPNNNNNKLWFVGQYDLNIQNILNTPYKSHIEFADVIDIDIDIGPFPFLYEYIKYGPIRPKKLNGKRSLW